ncbi:MAG TPA: histidinol-phosphate transaminase [Terriglobales bacterium]
MLVSRRNFLRTVGTGAVAGAVTQLPAVALPLFEPPRAQQPGGPIRLNSNENAYGPSEKVLASIRETATLSNRYPFPEYDRLIESIANHHHVKPEQVLLGCGSTEILRVAAVGLLGPGKKYVQASPTFETTGHYAELAGAEVVSVPLTRDFAHDLDAMLGRSDASTGLVYICNPNNPTGSITPRKDIEAFIGKLPRNTRVLIDEAYHHFVDSPGYTSFVERPLEDERVIVARTFSKIYGMAGLRIGYAIATPQIVKQLEPYATDTNVNEIAARAAVTALEDTDTVRDFISRNARDRREFFIQAEARKLKPIPSQTNFVMMDVSQPAVKVIEHFRKHDVLIGRRFPPMDTCVRISFGKPDEMKEFWKVWDAVSRTS